MVSESMSGTTTDSDLDQLTELFRLLSDKTRLNILIMLAQGERNVSSLREALKLPQPTVSHHLGLLRMNNVVRNRRHGKQVYYGLNGRVETGESGGLTLAVENFSVSINGRQPTA